jgi:formyl-CoA transferase
MKEPLVERRLLSATDPVTGVKIRMPPPPNMTTYLEAANREMSFPPRFGEHNKEIYGEVLGHTDQEIAGLKEKGII